MKRIEELADASGNANHAFRTVGNPPYQKIIADEASTSEQKTVVNIFHLFHEVARETSLSCSFIYPARRWMHGSGKALRTFGPMLVNSPHLRKVIYWHRSDDVFQEVKIGDGITVVFEDFNRHDDKWELDFRWENKNLFSVDCVAHPGEAPVILDPRQREIVEKIWDRNWSSLRGRATPQKTFSLESNYVELNPEKVRELENIPQDPQLWVRALLNDGAGKGGRARWYWLPRDEVRSREELIDCWKVIVSSMNCVGARGTGHSPLAEILPPGTVFGRSRLALGVFNTENEARNFFTLVSTPLYRFLYGALGDSQSLLGVMAPDLQSYDEKCPIDLSGTTSEVQARLVKFFDLTEAQNAFVMKWVSDNLAPFAKDMISV